MNRRNFLSLFPAAVAGFTLHQAIPFNRVWSFPKEIKIPSLATTINTAHPSDRLEIGDIVAFADWPGQFVVSQVAGDDKCHLYSAEQRLIIRGVLWSKLTPLFAGNTIRVIELSA